MSKTQTKNICSKASNLCREMLDLMEEENVNCSIHESDLTTSIVLKSCTEARAGYTIVKSHQADMKNPKVLRNKISTNRVRHATELKVDQNKTQDSKSEVQDSCSSSTEGLFQQSEDELCMDNDVLSNDEARKGENNNIGYEENHTETKHGEGKQPPLPNW